MLENTPVQHDCSVLVLSVAELRDGRPVRATLNYRWIGPDDSVVDTRTDLKISIPTDARDPETWLKQVLGEVILGLK